MPRTIICDTPDGERMILHDSGQIERPARGLGPSGNWVITGAVTLSNLPPGHDRQHHFSATPAPGPHTLIEVVLNVHARRSGYARRAAPGS